MGNYTADWVTNNIRLWENTIGFLKGVQVDMIEIGTFEGRSAVWFLENILTHPDSHLDCIDHYKGSPEYEGFNFDMEGIKERAKKNLEPFGKKVNLIIENSATYLKGRTKKATLIYIDGSHMTNNTLTDAVLSNMLLKPNGIIIFDDYLWHGLQINTYNPKMAIDSFMMCFQDDYELVGTGYQIVLRKKLV